MAVYDEKPRNRSVYDESDTPKHVRDDLLHRDVIV